MRTRLIMAAAAVAAVLAVFWHLLEADWTPAAPSRVDSASRKAARRATSRAALDSLSRISACSGERCVEAIVARLTSDPIGCRDLTVMEDLIELEDMLDDESLLALTHGLVAGGQCRSFLKREHGAIRIRKSTSDTFPGLVHVTADFPGEHLDVTTDPWSSVVLSDPLSPNLWWWIPRSAVAYQRGVRLPGESAVVNEDVLR